MEELRKRQEEIENLILGSFAQKSVLSKGRQRIEKMCEVRTEFQRDRDRILHSKAFRRMKHKTQVFISPEGDHYRTRLTHTLEVAQIARTISRALALNEDLTEAIALGHDLGHTPFGHAGERALREVCSFGFEHEEQSLRVVDYLEKDGMGLNLTWEVRNGILNHRTKGNPETMEGKVVQLSDKIAYTNHDIDDAFRAGVLTELDIPEEYVCVLGNTFSQRVNAMICDTISYSQGKDRIQMSPVMASTLKGLRNFMFKMVYASVVAEKEHEKAEHIVKELYQYYMYCPDKMNQEFVMLIQKGETKEQAVCDYIACMSDRFAIANYSEIFIPKSWSVY